MASIDKIYATKLQRAELYNWLLTHKPSLLRYLYEWYPEYDADTSTTHPISNFPRWADNWLLKHCDIAWVTRYIKSQYE